MASFKLLQWELSSISNTWFVTIEVGEPVYMFNFHRVVECWCLDLIFTFLPIDSFLINFNDSLFNSIF